MIDLTTRDGSLELVRRVRADARTHDSMVIAVSGCVFPADGAAAERAGCDVFLPKPRPPDTLVQAVRNGTSGVEHQRPPFSSDSCDVIAALGIDATVLHTQWRIEAHSFDLRSVRYLFSGSTIPADKRSALKLLTESKT